MKKPSKSDLILIVQQLVKEMSEVQAASNRNLVCLSFTADLLIEKGVFSKEEFEAFFAKKMSSAGAPNNPRQEESQCPADTSLPSSTPSTTPTTT